jgi:hypothetical protein
MLKHEPHSLNIVSCKSPIALGIQVAQIEALLHAQLDTSRSSGDLTCDEGLTATG